MRHAWNIYNRCVRCDICREDFELGRSTGCNIISVMSFSVVNVMWKCAEHVLVFCVSKQAAKRGYNREETKRIARREMRAIWDSLAAHWSFQKSEAVILDERLSRRYDPGLALNEAVQRAIAAKKADGKPSPDILTARQKLSLKFQEEYLQRVVKNS